MRSTTDPATAEDWSRQKASAGLPRRLFHQNLSFLRDRRLHRILELAGHELRFGLPKPGDGVLVWGASPTAWRGEAAARRCGAPLIRVEDAFLRSLRPGRAGDAPIGILLDDLGVHFDASRPSRLEEILAGHPLSDPGLLARAEEGIARLRHLHLSKYNLHDPDLPPPAPGYVLVVDQTAGDASLRASGADAATLRAMLEGARRAHPGARILLKAHPETQQGLRPGHFQPDTLPEGVELVTAPHSPWHLLDGAVAVHTVSSQLGFEAILAGHRPHVWGQPFYAGWDLSEDHAPPPRRGRPLSAAQLFAAAMILAPIWYHPCHDRLCRFEDAVDQLEAETRAWRADRQGYIATGMRMWKRGRLQAFFGRERRLRFIDDPARAFPEAAAKGQKLLIWAGKYPKGCDAPALRVEDGFLRSRGLGAELVPPLSLVTDDLGIYYDPTRPSRLEQLILGPLPPGGRERALRLIRMLRATGLTKYNLGGSLPELPRGHRILVPGQVEDDASIRKGAGEIRRNLDLLEATRAANPDAVILYKPHPDVMAGLREGAVEEKAALRLADRVVAEADMAALLDAVDEVWTMTSLTGFEALIRGKAVTVFGAPFYAGWGLTRDLGPVPERRRLSPDGAHLPRPDLAQLVHAALIAYPRYWDPVARRACSVEVALARLSHGDIPHSGRLNRLISKLQGRLASHAWLWR